MIESRELTRRARDLGVSQDHVRGDYVLNHMLASISDSFGELNFRGGTALARVYWPDFRLSEDLDFIVDTMPPDFEQRLAECVSGATRRTDWQLKLRSGPARRGRHRFFVVSDFGEILIDVQSDERPHQPITMGKLTLPYSDLIEKERSIPTIALSEILGNKWFMLDESDRKEPRDLYDLWAGTELFSVPFEEIAAGHKAKYGYSPHTAQIKRAKGLEDLWQDRLSHQLAKLPPFHEALEAVTKSFDEWNSRSDT